MRTMISILLMSQVFYLCISNARDRWSTPVETSNYIDPYGMINEGEALLKEGDLVVRLNQDPISQFIKNFNRSDKNYSHAGIVLCDNGYPYIYHIVNGEESPDEKLRKDSLVRFCSPRKNLAYGIFRYDLRPNEIQSLKNILHNWFQKEVRFDSTFNLASDDKMYCSEMISKALIRASQKRISIGATKLTTIEAGIFSTHLHLPFSHTSKLRIVSIDNLYKNPYCSLVKEYDYKQHK